MVIKFQLNGWKQSRRTSGSDLAHLSTKSLCHLWTLVRKSSNSLFSGRLLLIDSILTINSILMFFLMQNLKNSLAGSYLLVRNSVRNRMVLKIKWVLQWIRRGFQWVNFLITIFRLFFLFAIVFHLWSVEGRGRGRLRWYNGFWSRSHTITRAVVHHSKPVSGDRNLSLEWSPQSFLFIVNLVRGDCCCLRCYLVTKECLLFVYGLGKELYRVLLH